MMSMMSYSSLGEQPSVRTNPRFKMPKEKRFKKAKPLNEIGPGEYKPLSSIGTQSISTKLSAPSYGFGKPPKRRTKRRGRDPQFVDSKSLSSIGVQKLSSKKTAPSCSFSGRVAFGSFAKQHGLLGPGPGAYEIPGGIGSQVVSTKNTAPSSTFPRSKKGFNIPADESPGPAYALDGLMDKAVDSTKRSGPKYTFRGGREFKAPPLKNKRQTTDVLDRNITQTRQNLNHIKNNLQNSKSSPSLIRHFVAIDSGLARGKRSNGRPNF
eukprot:TRINITY_DN7152_c0_g1_i1.p1 TRINITY_DN7152_c0_g1~~TRINITY_DN7152_c0_g1_i1.p1  ORF type:complete len:266 (-),score=58.59 TRINITY_DN7152_c0_g1_i1:222-1019(-)